MQKSKPFMRGIVSVACPAANRPKAVLELVMMDLRPHSSGRKPMQMSVSHIHACAISKWQAWRL